MQRVTGLPFEPTAPHAVIVLGVPDDRLDSLALDPLPLLCLQGLVFAAMNQLHRSDFGIHIPEAKINDGSLLPQRIRQRFEQDGGLFELAVQRVAVIRVAGEAARAYDRPLLVRDGRP